MQYKNVHRPLKDIARELGVDGILEGSVVDAGGPGASNRGNWCMLLLTHTFGRKAIFATRVTCFFLQQELCGERRKKQ